MRRGLFSLMLGLLLPTACGGPIAATPPTSAPTGQMTVLRTGYIPVVIYAPLFVGIERGYFRDEGIEIALTPIQSGNEAVVQLAAGNFDISLGGANAGLFNAAARGVAFTVVAPLHSERPPLSTPLIISARRTGEIRSVADLRGKKIAVNAIGAGTEYWLAQALARGGLTMQDIELTAMPFPNIPAALESGSLDAAVVTEPVVTAAMDKGIVSVLSNDYIDGFTATYVYMGADLIGRPEVARRFLRAYLRACRDLQGDYMTDEVAGIIEKYTEVPAGVLRRIPAPQYSPDGALPTADLQALEEYFRSRGLLEYQEPLDIAAIVNAELAREAAESLR